MWKKTSVSEFLIYIFRAKGRSEMRVIKELPYVCKNENTKND